MTESAMTSNKPYLIRALHAWISDNGCTPYLYVNTDDKQLQLPEHLLADNPLVLNISFNACKNLQLENNAVSFQTRFSGQVVEVSIPMPAIIALIARENGQGMTFEWETTEPHTSESDTQHPSKTAEKKPGLKIIR